MTRLQFQEGKFSASQHLEIAQNREVISESAPRISPPLFLREGSGVGLLGPVDEAFEVSGSGVPHPPTSPRERAAKIHGEVEGKFSASQSIEIARNREGISESPPRISPPRSYGEGSGLGLFGIGCTADRSSRRLRSSRQTRAGARLPLANLRQPA